VSYRGHIKDEIALSLSLKRRVWPHPATTTDEGISSHTGHRKGLAVLSTPLRDFPIVASRNPVDLINSAMQFYRGAISPVGPLLEGEHLLRGLAAQDFSIGYIASNLQVRIAAAPATSSYFVNFGVAGQLRATCQNQSANLSDTHGTVFNPGDAQELHPKTQAAGLLGLRIDADLVQHELSSLVGRPVEAPLRFDLRLDLSQPNGRAIGMLVTSFIDQLDSGDPLFKRPSVQRAQMRSIVTGLLMAQPHNYTCDLNDEPRPPHPRGLRMALSYIEENLAERFTLGDMARAADCSARTLGNLFVQNFGVSPMAYVRNIRLDRIRADIRSTDDGVGVVAYRWGVTHLGRFASDYCDRFRELPSQTAARR
jgi:AraC-like DNA-binding protein